MGEDLKVEVWREIPGYEGRYSASSQGRVLGPSGKILKPWIHKGYPYVHLGAGNKTLVAYVVLLAFVGPRPPGYSICHGNGDRLDSRLENLRYDTAQENTRDTVMYCGINTQKLSPLDVLDIARRRKNGEKRKSLAAEYGVNESTIWRAVTGRSFQRLAEEVSVVAGKTCYSIPQ